MGLFNFKIFVPENIQSFPNFGRKAGTYVYNPLSYMLFTEWKRLSEKKIFITCMNKSNATNDNLH